MLWCYLLSDVIGSYSKITYGLQGDKIAIIGRHNEMVKVLHEDGQIFFVKEHLISINFINKNQNNGTTTKPRNKKRI
jgi:hypothetical protein